MNKVLLATAFAVASLLATSTAAQSGPFPLDPNSPRVGVAQDRAACQLQDWLPWCGQQPAATESTRTWSTQDVVTLQATLTASMNYSYAPTQPWRSSYDRASTGLAWADDCDGLVFTLFEALDRAGFPRDKMWRAIVRPAGSAGMVRHMVGVVEVDGAYLVVGDTNAPAPYPLARATFKPDLVSHVSAGRTWLRVPLNASLITRVASN
jgi:hypothetical protein